MGKHAVILLGPAGSGKSTLSGVLAEHYRAMGRSVHVCNFDPAADELAYEPTVDIRDLISVEDAMDGKGLGPNGGLVFAMEYMIQNGTWLVDQLGDFMDDFLIADMPGQIELTSHIPVIPQMCELLKQQGYFVTVLFLLDALAATGDAGKFVSGCLFTLCSMTSIDSPFINLLTKCDLLGGEFKEKDLEHFCMCDFDFLNMSHLPPKWKRMTQTVATIVNDFSLVGYRPMDVTDPECVRELASSIDQSVQYTEDAEVNDKEDIPGFGGGNAGENEGDENLSAMMGGGSSCGIGGGACF